MPWFKVDDKLHSHKKAARVGMGALGLWAVCGSWSMDQLTDGFVPDYIARRIDPNADDNATELVAAGFWEVDEHDGDAGWRFHDWADHQPTREAVETRREYEREKKRNQRRSPAGTFQASPGESLGDSEGSPPGSPTVPSRPVPSRPSTPNGVDAPRKRGCRLDAGFIPSAESRAKILTDFPMLDLAREHAKFVDYWTDQPGAKGTRLSWDGTWRNWMRRAGEQLPVNGKSRRQQETDDLFSSAARRMGVTSQPSIEGAAS